MTRAYAAHEGANETSTPLPCRWPRYGTLPQHSNGRHCSGASRTERQGCRPGTPCSPKWTSECWDNPSSQRQCRGPVPWVPRATGYDLNESEYNPVPSRGKRLGNQVPRTRYGPTSPS
jgi:hypothetical protein